MPTTALLGVKGCVSHQPRHQQRGLRPNKACVYSSAATSEIAISAGVPARDGVPPRESARDVEELAESPPRLRSSAVLSALASTNASLATSAARQSAAALIGMRFPTLVRSVLSLRKRVPVGNAAPW